MRLDVIQRRMSDGRIIADCRAAYTGAVRLAKDVTAGEYDVTVDDAPTSPNQKEANWLIISSLIPVFKDQIDAQPELLAMILEYSPLPAPLVAAFKRIALAPPDPAKLRKQQKAKE